MHLALAAAIDRDLDPDRRAWHLAAAASGPDEGVAIELERSADRARTRGGFAAAAAFLQRSVELTCDPDRRTDRALAAAHATLQAGEFDSAVRLLDAAESASLGDLQRARVDLLRAEAAYSLRRGSDAPPLLLRAAKTLETLDVMLARETYLDAWSAALFAGRLATNAGLHDVSGDVRNAPRPAGTPRPADLLLDGFALVFTEGRASAAPILERAAAGFSGGEASVEEILRWGWLATAAAALLWDHETCLAASARGVEVARDSGALAVLAVSLNVATQGVVLAGNFATALVLMTDANAVVEATGTLVAPYGALTLAGFLGVEAEASPLIDKTIEEATAGGQGTAVQYAHWARSVLCNGLGRYAEALTAAQIASDDTPELFVSDWALSELIEAAVRSRRLGVARDALTRLTEHTRATPTDWGLGLEARAQALLSEGESADRLYREALTRLSRTRLRPELARAHLLYGEWLRRESRRVDARAELRKAHALFTTIGMHAFAERARIELVATGEKLRKRTVETRDDLTAHERHIAQLARDGLSNPEIRRTPVSQSPHRGVASAQGVHQARYRLAQGACERATEIECLIGGDLVNTPNPCVTPSERRSRTQGGPPLACCCICGAGVCAPMPRRGDLVWGVTRGRLPPSVSRCRRCRLNQHVAVPVGTDRRRDDLASSRGARSRFRSGTAVAR